MCFAGVNLSLRVFLVLTRSAGVCLGSRVQSRWACVSQFAPWRRRRRGFVRLSAYVHVLDLQKRQRPFPLNWGQHVLICSPLRYEWGRKSRMLNLTVTSSSGSGMKGTFHFKSRRLFFYILMYLGIFHVYLGSVKTVKSELSDSSL